MTNLRAKIFDDLITLEGRLDNDRDLLLIQNIGNNIGQLYCEIENVARSHNPAFRETAEEFLELEVEND